VATLKKGDKVGGFAANLIPQNRKMRRHVERSEAKSRHPLFIAAAVMLSEAL